MADDIVLVFDFDKTIIDSDSDNWVVDEFGATTLFDRLTATMPWNSVMDLLMGLFHAQGKTTDDIEESLKRIPLHPKIKVAIQSAYFLGCDLRIVSDSNVFFIETVLKHHGLFHCFSEINTNPSYVDQDGRLRILPFNDHVTSSPHGCGAKCPSNLCKGLVMKQMKASLLGQRKMKRFIYLGDGTGDFCPTTNLGQEDFVMPRKDFPLWDLIYDGNSSSHQLIKAQVHGWRDGEEFEKVLSSLISSILDEESAKLTPEDCRLSKMTTIAPTDAVPQAFLHVHH